jgi:ketosteroid isomerase-like protein
MAERGDLEAVMAAWEAAVMARNAAGCLALCTDDVLILSSDAPTARGAEAARRVLQGWLDAGGSAGSSWTIAAYTDGDRPMLARGYAMTFDGDRGPVAERGRYLVAFRAVGGDWRIEALALFDSGFD